MYGSAIFFDNSNYHTDDFTKLTKITTVNVGETSEAHSLPIDSPIFSNFIKASGLQLNSYYFVLYATLAEIAYDPLSGIKVEHINILDDWIKTVEGKGVAIFDWDRTMTVFEGLYLPPGYVDTNQIVDERRLSEAWLSYIHGQYPHMSGLIELLQVDPITFEDVVLAMIFRLLN